MAKDHFYSAIVNQKLAFARIELEAAELRDGDNLNDRLVRHAHLDSAAAQLHGALCYFVAEVAEQYSLHLEPGRAGLLKLLAQFVESGRQAAAIGELLGLQKKGGSWLSELLAAQSDPLFLPQQFKGPAQTEAGDGLIPLVEVSSASERPEHSPEELVRRWAGEAQATVDRLRTSLHEE